MQKLVINALAYGACGLLIWSGISLLEILITLGLSPDRSKIATAFVIVPVVGVVSAWTIAFLLYGMSKLRLGAFAAIVVPCIAAVAGSVVQGLLLQIHPVVAVVAGLSYPYYLIRRSAAVRNNLVQRFFLEDHDQ